MEGVVTKLSMAECGGTRAYTHDPLMRLRRLLSSDPGGNALLDVQYQYDRLNNILTTTTPQGTVNYTYDAISRLTGVQVEHPTAGQPDEGFTYDRVGNRTTEAGIEGEWHYNANNELLTFASTEYSYDANGNTAQITLDGTVMFTYHYNTHDRLVQVDDVSGATIGRYYYKPFGRRLWKQAGGQTTLFFSSDEGLAAEYNPTGADIRAYGYRPDSTWTTDPLWLKQNGEYYFYHNDHLGTPQKLVKQNGAVVWSASYTAFGQATIEVETVTNNLRFPGQYYDVETGLHYNFHRYYAPGIGRYLRVDPIGFIGIDINLYGYGLKNPINFFDSQGFNPYDTLFSCRNIFGGNNPLNRELTQLERRFPRQESKWPHPPALYLAGEAHVVLGSDIISYGQTYLTCCTSDNRAMIYIYEKECRGRIAVTLIRQIIPF